MTFSGTSSRNLLHYLLRTTHYCRYLDLFWNWLSYYLLHYLLRTTHYCRYLDLFWNWLSYYNVVMKIIFIVSSLAIEP